MEISKIKSRRESFSIANPDIAAINSLVVAIIRGEALPHDAKRLIAYLNAHLAYTIAADNLACAAERLPQSLVYKP